MGLFDSIKKAVGVAQQHVAQPPLPPAHAEPEHEQEADDGDALAFDMAGFDPRDEGAFFDAMLHMESEGVGGGTDASRAEIMARYGIRDRLHWQAVRDSVYHALVGIHGSQEIVMQREMNYRSGLVQRQMQGAVAAKAASGEMAPAFGVSLESWAAMNAALIQGANLEDLLKGAGIDKPRWDSARSEWEARMARDTTFAIAQIYGAAFQNASKGRFADLAREANAARAENRELKLQPPMSMQEYFDIMFEQAYAAKQGKDPIATLKGMGLSVVDWTDLSSYMGYLFHRTAGLENKKLDALVSGTRAKFEAKYAGVKADVDIAF